MEKNLTEIKTTLQKFLQLSQGKKLSLLIPYTLESNGVSSPCYDYLSTNRPALRKYLENLKGEVHITYTVSKGVNQTFFINAIKVTQ